MEAIIHALLALCCVLALNFVLRCLIKRIKDHFKLNVALIVEDSLTERKVMEFKLHIPSNCKPVWVDSVENVSLWYRFVHKPAIVLADNHLNGSVKGAELVKYYDSHGIPTKLMTADCGEIPGIPEEKILRKQTGDKFYVDASNWMHEQLNLV